MALDELVVLLDPVSVFPQELPLKPGVTLSRLESRVFSNDNIWKPLSLMTGVGFNQDVCSRY